MLAFCHCVGYHIIVVCLPIIHPLKGASSMSLQLLMGRAGTGKTRHCLDQIHSVLKQEPLGPPLILIVPAQATFNMERELAARGGSLRAQVYSFRRLAYRVLRETGGLARHPVSELGRRMMLKKILLEYQSQLKMLGSLHQRPGFLASLSQLISELRTCQISPLDLTPICAGLEENSLGYKLRDLRMVYEKLESDLAGRLIDPDHYLDLLARQIPHAPCLEGCRVWIDGFISFTPQEGEVVKNLISRAGELVITLCLDEKAAAYTLPGHHPFMKPKQTYQRLRRQAREQGAPIQENFLPPSSSLRYAGSPELYHLEQQFFQYPAQPYQEPVSCINVMSGVNIRAEVEGVVRSMRRLLRDEGLRLRQVMVLVRDVDVYFPLFRQLLDDYEIPFFIDHRRPVMHHPLVELLRSALEVWQSNWHYDAVFRFLKTGLSKLTREQVDLLENYVLAAGIRGSGWYQDQPWRYLPGQTWYAGEAEDQDLPPELEQINNIRRQAAAELRAAQIKFKERAAGRPRRLTGREWALILLELCLDLDVPGRLEGWSRAAGEAGRLELAREHRQIWKLTSSLWDEFVEILGDTGLTIQEAAAVIDAGLEAVSFSHIPPGPDAITVGSFERSRPPGDIEALFITGLTERALPAQVRRYGMFTEQERERFSRWLAEYDLEAVPGVEDLLHQEQFLIYRLLTRTGGRLFLSYPLGDEEGKAVTPSPVIRRMRELFPSLDIDFLPAEPAGDTGALEFIEHPAGVLPRLPLRWQEAVWGYPVEAVWWQVYNLLLNRAGWRSRLALLVSAFTRRNIEFPLGRDLGLALFGRERKKRRVLAGSASSLESFTKCPFSHFLAYGLRLQERPVYRLAPLDTGQLYHEVLREFVQEINAGGLDWGQLTGENVDSICAGIVEKLAPRLQGGILLSSPRLQRQKERLLERVAGSARALAEQLKSSDFSPAALEVYFGPAAKKAPPIHQAAAENVPGLMLPPLELDLGDGAVLLISGRIDRVDAAVHNHRLYVHVIDYKSSLYKLDLAQVLSGVQLQLLVYLWAVLEHFSLVCGPEKLALVPAGAFYFRVHRPVITVDNPTLTVEGLAKEWLKQYKLSGWLVDHGLEIMRLQDHNLGPGVTSLTIPAQLKKDGTISARQKTSTYTPVELEYVLGMLREILVQAGRHILDGRVDIAPVKLGPDHACQFCPFSTICNFDLWLPENRYRSLTRDAKEARQKVEKKAARKGGDRLVLYKLD